MSCININIFGFYLVGKNVILNHITLGDRLYWILSDDSPLSIRYGILNDSHNHFLGGSLVRSYTQRINLNVFIFKTHNYANKLVHVFVFP